MQQARIFIAWQLQFQLGLKLCEHLQMLSS